MPPLYYILVDGVPIPVDADTWARWYQEADRRVDRTEVRPGVEVSTVFLGLDHSFGDGPPLIYETMIFRGANGEECWRYATRAEAVTGHRHAVELAAAEQ